MMVEVRLVISHIGVDDIVGDITAGTSEEGGRSGVDDTRADTAADACKGGVNDITAGAAVGDCESGFVEFTTGAVVEKGREDVGEAAGTAEFAILEEGDVTLGTWY